MTGYVAYFTLVFFNIYVLCSLGQYIMLYNMFICYIMICCYIIVYLSFQRLYRNVLTIKNKQAW